MAISNSRHHLLQTKKPLSLPLLAIISISLMLLNRVNSSDSLSFSFDKFEPKSEDLILQGDASIPSSEAGIQLTKTDFFGVPVSHSVGRALYYLPVRLWDKNTGRLASFETSFSFVLTSSLIKPLHPSDGIAFFIAPPDTTVPPDSAGGLLGLFSPDNALNNSLNQIVAVEFDTHINEDWDPSYRHIGIDVNSIRSTTDVPWERKSGEIATARISYNSASNKLKVFSSYPASETSEDYTLSYDIDLTTILPEWVRIGLSASTGGDVQKHNILSWSFSSNLQSSKAKMKDMYIARYV